MSDISRRYVLITPCRDEAAYLPTAIASVDAQTVRPSLWVIVDDGSSDATPQILEEAASTRPYIRVIRRDDRGERSVGPGVVEAFYEGVNALDLDEFDYLCKFDADLSIAPRYFERVMEFFECDPWLGTLSGKLFIRSDGRLIEERCGDENSVGAAKFYRVACFRDIGGFVRHVGWDGIDGHMCRMKGWTAQSIQETDLRVVHLRRMGTSQDGLWNGRLRWGRGKYNMGSSLAYVGAVSLYRMFERPWLVSGIGILVGYMQAMLTRQPRFGDPTFRRFLRQYELRSLLFGKKRTTQRYHRRIRSEPGRMPTAAP